jgi:hypothetical protein
MALTRRGLRSATTAQDNAEAVAAAVPLTSQLGTDKKAPSSAKGPSKPHQLKKKTEIRPDANVAEVVEREKATHLAKVEDEATKKATKAKTAHPHRRAPQPGQLLLVSGHCYLTKKQSRWMFKRTHPKNKKRSHQSLQARLVSVYHIHYNQNVTYICC